MFFRFVRYFSGFFRFFAGFFHAFSQVFLQVLGIFLGIFSGTFQFFQVFCRFFSGTFPGVFAGIILGIFQVFFWTFFQARFQVFFRFRVRLVLFVLGLQGFVPLTVLLLCQGQRWTSFGLQVRAEADSQLSRGSVFFCFKVRCSAVKDQYCKFLSRYLWSLA